MNKTSRFFAAALAVVAGSAAAAERDDNARPANRPSFLLTQRIRQGAAVPANASEPGTAAAPDLAATVKNNPFRPKTPAATVPEAPATTSDLAGNVRNNPFRKPSPAATPDSPPATPDLANTVKSNPFRVKVPTPTPQPVVEDPPRPVDPPRPAIQDPPRPVVQDPPPVVETPKPVELQAIRQVDGFYQPTGEQLAQLTRHFIGQRIIFDGVVAKMSNREDAEGATFMISSDQQIEARVAWAACPPDLQEHFMLLKKRQGNAFRLYATVLSGDGGTLVLRVHKWQDRDAR